jgi:hypothetical protein
MSPTHAAKGGRRWRYYVSQAILQGREHEAGAVARVSAFAIEQKVAEAVRVALSSPSNLELSATSQRHQQGASRLSHWSEPEQARLASDDA